MKAAERILKDAGNVIHRNRWPYIKDEEQRQAALHHGGNRQRERRQQIIAALFALAPLPQNRITAESIFVAYTKLRGNLQESVTKDLRGLTWRQGVRRKPQEKGDRVLCPPYERLVPTEALLRRERKQRIRVQAEELPTLADLSRALQLSPRQTIIAHLADMGYMFAEIATYLGVSVNSVHQHSHTIRKIASRARGR
jgi:DNA-binding CsgD family transcriptional regulator